MSSNTACCRLGFATALPLVMVLALGWRGADAVAGEWSGNVAGELRYFPQRPIDPRQFEGANLSISTLPEYYREWDGGRDSFTFEPFARLDQHDERRTHADIRQLDWVRARDTWELRLGVRQVFWGVTESQHLVDIINQTDLIENIDGEDKLGQPMVNLALVRNWGTLDLFALTGFRERTFPGVEGRLRQIPRVDTSRPEYQSRHDTGHVDLAARWSHFIGDWDLGLSQFRGTSREPRFGPGETASGELVLIPIYDIIDQTGLEVQATRGSWLWKFEGIYRSGQGPSYGSATGGFEYTFFDLSGKGADLGVLLEYLWDSRGADAPVPFENDVFAGVRLALNDVQSTELLTGVIYDRRRDERLFTLEASRRLGDNFRLSVEARGFDNVFPRGSLFSLREDDFLQLELAYFF